MKSNTCKIKNGIADLSAILKESEKVAVYNELNHKQTLQLRLICEELDCMLPHIVDQFNGDFWIEFEKNVCKVRASINIYEFSAEKKSELIRISKDGNNASSVGIAGKIRNLIENFFLNEENYMNSFAINPVFTQIASERVEYSDYYYTWTLDEYRTSVKSEGNPVAWDELEKSVIASVADDVIVGVKGNRADIVIVKKFA